jgi:type IV pilus assembly protein PilY1
MKTPHQRPFVAGLVALLFTATAWGFTPSAQPPESTAVPGNVMLALSVEHPTGLQVSYRDTTYTSTAKYEGYFDNRKCYTYDKTAEVFNPNSAVLTTNRCANDEWSGNLLNWLTMTNLDQFRSVMTGGTRDNFTAKAKSNANYFGDSTARTILIRSFSDRNEYNPIKTLPSNAAVPSDFRGKSVRSGGYGSKFIVSNGTFNNMDTHAIREQSCSEHTGINQLGCFNIRVSVCVMSPAQGVVGNIREANCKARYSGVAKPEGLVQEYAATLRFGAFGYLNQSGNDRNGGVLRSAMKSVGPVAATSTGVIVNPNPEWNTTTGVISVNPDPTDATASNVGNSGLMNYLNKFGYAAGYKGNDPVGEMYYAAQRYLRGYELPASYTSLPTNEPLASAYKDGFPVITGAAHSRGGTRDPIINTCQKNFMLGIGDIYTHEDGQLPGRNNGPTDSDSLNVETLWTHLTTLEGSTAWTGGAGGGTPYMAGLAHWANTNDIRSDLNGKQTISTYWVDVLENGNGVNGMPAAGTQRTQYWLAAKYGGFDTKLTPGDDPKVKIAPADATVEVAWDKNGDGVPDNWFAGSTPTLLKSGLSAAFSKINNEAGAAAASSAAVTSSRQTSSSQIIYAGYNPKDWTGNVRACTPAQTAEQCADSPIWDASNWINSTSTVVATADKLTSATRKIFTSFRNTTTPFAFSSMSFKWASLNDTQKAELNTDSNGENRVEFLRGSRANEGTLFRTRPGNLFGDVVNSGVTYLSGAGTALVGSNYPGHTTYRNSTRTRPPVVYVGGNDGMLHALNGSNGKELFGYIPRSVFGKLKGLSDFNFKHQYFVDSTPMVGDFEKTGSTSASPSWGTMLVGGLGAGGKGFYALDISSQSTFATASESDLAAALPMWEFSDAQDTDLGFTFNEPSINPITGVYRQIAKMADASEPTGVWRVVVGNGYGSLGDGTATGGGKAVLYLLNANTGAASTKLVADATGANGLSSPTPVDTDRDGLMDTVYAGDLKGNMHKFQFSVAAATGSDFVLARPTDTGAAWRYLGKVYTATTTATTLFPASTPEPITTAPSVIPACEGQGWNVMFGTGKLNEDTDYRDNTSRGFYNVVDRSPSSALTVVKNDLAHISPLSEVALADGDVGRTWTPPNLSGKRGWRMTFTGGERVLTNSTLPPDTGAVLFATTQPTGDVCTPGNSGFLMAVNICSGKIGDLVVNGVSVGGLSIDSSGIVKVSNTYTNQDNKQTVVCNQDGCKPTCSDLTDPDCRPPDLLGQSAPRGRYSWREILSK